MCKYEWSLFPNPKMFLLNIRACGFPMLAQLQVKSITTRSIFRPKGRTSSELRQIFAVANSQVYTDLPLLSLQLVTAACSYYIFCSIYLFRCGGGGDGGGGGGGGVKVHPTIAGKKWRFAYLMASDHPDKPIPYQEIVKFDREGCSMEISASAAPII